MIFLHELLVYVPYFLECMLLSCLMLHYCTKRKNYALNAALILVCGVLWQLPIAALIYIEDSDFEAAFGIVKFLLCLTPLYFIGFIYKVRLLNLVYVIVISLLFQRWSAVFAEIIVGFTPLAENFYFGRAVAWVCFILMTVVIWLFYIRPLSAEGEPEHDGIVMLLFIMLFALFEVVQVFMRNFVSSGVWQLVLNVFELAFGVFMLYQSLRVARRNKERAEKMVSDALLQKERQQFETLKTNMESMKAQVHDLKYVMRALREGGANGELAEKLGTVVGAYESNYNTGCVALDIILADADKNFKSKNIRFECFTDISGISFMENYDLYSLMGNAFDNAAEYLLKQDPSNRYVSCTVKNKRAFVFIEIYNYYSGDGNAFVGMQSTKPDKDMHGYGIKNMQRIAKKYGGELTLRIEDCAFYVTAVIPVSKNQT